MKISPVARSMILVEAPMNTPIDSTAPRSTTTPSATSDRAPMKQSSSMITGLACSGSSTPPIPTPPDRWQLAPIWAQLPTVAQVSTMVFLPTQAPTLTKLGINTAPGAMNADFRTTAPGTARNPASLNRFSPQPANFIGTLSQTGAPPGPSMADESTSRNDSSTAFFSH